MPKHLTTKQKLKIIPDTLPPHVTVLKQQGNSIQICAPRNMEEKEIYSQVNILISLKINKIWKIRKTNKNMEKIVTCSHDKNRVHMILDVKQKFFM